MFGFALWDRGGRTLTLARDRIGIKPLYYGWFRETFLFGSELKALLSHPDFNGDLDRNSLVLFLRFNYIPAPYSIYKNVYKLPPGQFLTLSTSLERNSPEPYWCAKRMVEEASHSRCRDGIREATDQLDALLRDAIRLQMVADVPLGAFLSGGIDSSTVVAMMQAQSTSAVRTFTIGFNEGSRNEAEHSKGVARHLGTEHTELYASPELARDVIPLLPTIYDEPFADISQIPTFLVARMARRQVTVSLSGDGGDELFAGYRIYQLGLRRWGVLRRLPSAVRSLTRDGLRFIAEAHSSSDGSFMPVRRGLDGLVNERFHKIEALLKVTTPELLHQYHVSQWMWPLEVVPGAIEPLTAFTDARGWPDLRSEIERMMYMDLMTYLPEDTLTKVDRASMAVGLEARVPFLDHRIVDFAWRLPVEFKVHRGESKRILRLVLARYVPPRLFERPKIGFDAPLGGWLRGPLRPWVEELLDPSELEKQGIFNPAPIRQVWREHLRGKRDRAKQLWSVLMFQAWRQKWL
jgi:asparagine synthase (glutamine-hydrolysing)